MLFNITRASTGFEETVPPCEGCIKEERSEHWKIEIKDLNELAELAEKEDTLIIYPKKSGNLPEIVIYDDYVE
jgi:hypothetical protein